MGKGPQGLHPVAPSPCSFAGPSWRFRLGPQEMNLSAATLLSQSVETLPPPIPTCHSHDCKLADPRKLPGPSTSQRWDCLPSNQAHQLDKIKNFHSLDSIDTENLSTRGWSVWVHSSQVRLLDSSVHTTACRRGWGRFDHGVARDRVSTPRPDRHSGVELDEPGTDEWSLP